MNLYTEFHGSIPQKDIGKRLREIVKKETKYFKIMTGYGSTTGSCSSKQAAIKSLFKMKNEGLIRDFLPGEVRYEPLTSASPYYKAKMEYGNQIKNDSDYGNEGIVFIFI
ncbi:unknown [Staphylococcus sp. CAG:324]|jgi:hypothetical protein|nr:hypothetical protein [Staphylococcus sp.]CDC71359.1 unknown [Staphylococcus sp. CAG:324]